MRGSMFVILAVFLTGCLAGPTEKDKVPVVNGDNIVQSPERSPLEEALIRKLNAKCTQNDVSSCVMLKLVSYMNRMLKKAAIQMGDSLEITQNSSLPSVPYTPSEGLARLSQSADEEEQATQLIMDKAYSFISTRALRWRMFDDAELVIANDPLEDGSMNIGMSIKTPSTSETGRGKMKNLGPFIAAAAVKIGILGGLAFKALTLLVGKALLVSKVALLLASIIGLKKLFSHQKHVTYEVVSHPHHSHESSGHDTFSSGWGRSATDMAYAAQIPSEVQNQQETEVVDQAPAASENFGELEEEDEEEIQAEDE